MAMARLLKIFEPAPAIAPRSDPAEIAREYRYWRWRIFYSIYIGYVVYYFTRKSYTFAMPHMLKDLNLTMAELGFLGTSLYLTYGVSKFVSGFLSDRANPRYFMAAGLIFTGIVNIFFGMSSSLLMFAVFWGLNGFFQGFGWPPCAKQLAYWSSAKERGLWYSAKATSHNVGGALIPVLIALVCDRLGWRWSMYVPGCIGIAVGFWLINRLRDRPVSLGLPTIEAFHGEVEKEEVPVEGNGLKFIVWESVLKNKLIWLISLANLFVYVLRTGINDWVALYLIKFKGFETLAASSAVSWFEIGGFLGMFFAGWCSDTLFKGQRLPIVIIASFALFASVASFWLVPQHQHMLDYAAVFAIGFLIYIPQVLIGLAALESVDKTAACTANGFTGLWAYIGAALAGYPIGKIIDIWGWSGFFVTMGICAILTFLLLLPLWPQKKPVKMQDQTENAIASA